MTKLGLAAVFVMAAALAGARAAHGHQATEDEANGQASNEASDVAVAGVADGSQEVVYSAGYQEAPPPLTVESAPVAAPGGGGFCYGGPHPVDTRVVEGPPWDETDGTHLHPYAPFDLRLFSLRNGCYYFVGDPTDFGYRGTTYQYYGAHPVLDLYGGGWCFMIAGHAHWWRPWSPYFTVAGPWFYWQGAYDPFFWSYWPYYASYYRGHYPRYYGGGRFYRGAPRDRLVAPPVGRVAGGPARAMPGGSMAGGGFTTGVPPMGGTRPAPARGYSRTPGWPSPGNGWTQPGQPGRPNTVGGDVPQVGWSDRLRRTTPAPAAPGGWSAGNRSGGGAYVAPQRGYSTQPRPGFQGNASGWSGSNRSAPAPSYRSAPAPSPSSGGTRGFPSSGSSSGSSGGFRSGGGSWRR